MYVRGGGGGPVPIVPSIRLYNLLVHLLHLRRSGKLGKLIFDIEHIANLLQSFFVVLGLSRQLEF